MSTWNRPRRWLTRVLVVGLVWSSVFAPLLSRSVSATPVADEGRLDLAAIIPTPQDLADAGLEGYGLYRARFVTRDEVAEQVAAEGNLLKASVRTVLDEAELHDAYEAILAVPTVPGDASSPYQQSVVTSLRVYADETGAAAAYAAFSLTSQTDGEPATTTIGDESRLTRRVVTGESALHLDLRAGNLTVGVAIVDATGGEPSASGLEALAARLVERSAQVRAWRDPPLSRQAVLLTGEDVFLGGQYYQWLDEEAIAAYGATAETTAAYADLMTTLGARHSFYVWQRIPTGVAGPYDDTFYYGTVTRYPDVATASASIDGLLDRVRQDGYEEVTAIPDAAGFGDQSTGYTARISWDYQGTTYTFWYRVHTIRVATIVANVMFIAPEPLPPEAARNLAAAAQTRCLEQTDCRDPMRMPATLTGGDGPGDDPDADGSASDAFPPDSVTSPARQATPTSNPHT